ncbi:MAG: hypothetical protein LBI10_10070 [Deltaproteobacteria bacterium]|jgi:hypothetical protein|nr:hypothetical protein [Deltaproteobacteria bacterium]
MDKGIPSNPQKKNRLAFLVVALVVLCALVAGGYYYYQSQLAKEAFEIFSVSMNKAVGPNQWTTGSHDFSLLQRTLTVNDIKFSLKTPEKPQSLNFTVSQVRVKNGLRLATLNKILALADWRGQAETHIADELVIADIKTSFSPPSLEGDQGPIDFTISSINIESAKLISSGQEEVPGVIGFLKNLRLSSFVIDKITSNLKTKANAEVFNLALGPINLNEPRFLEGVKSLDDPLLFLKFFSFSCQEFRVQNFLFNFVAENRAGELSLKFGDLLEQGVSYDGRVKKANFKDLEFKLSENKGNIHLKMKLDSFDANGLDYSQFLNRAAEPVLERLIRIKNEGTYEFNREDFEQIYGRLYTLANMFSMPYDLDNISYAGMEITFNDVLTIGSKQGSLVGPFKTARVPASQSQQVDLYVRLPKEPQDKRVELLSLAYNFGERFGQTDFSFNFISKLSYDSSVGGYRIDQNSVVSPNLFQLEIGGQLTGLTETLIKKLNEIPIRDVTAIAGVEEILSLGLSNLAIQYNDASLFEKIIAAFSKETKIDPQIFRQALKEELIPNKLIEKLKLSGLSNPEPVTKILQSFVDNPQKLTLGVNPNQPFTALTALTLRNLYGSLNALKISVSANDSPPVILTFQDPLDKLLEGLNNELKILEEELS